MKSREELRRESAGNPQGMADYAFQLQEQLRLKDQALSEKEQLLAATHQELGQRQQELARQEQFRASLSCWLV